MEKAIYRTNIWEQMIRSSVQFPLDWASFEKEFQIKKLQLEKLEPKQILERKAEFEKKYQQDHQISKSWMENQYRLFIWFLFMYSKILFIPPQLFGPIEWNVISQCFSKQPLFCQYFYLSSKKMKSSEWTKEQDSFVQKMMESTLNKKWTQIGLQLFQFSGGAFFKKPKAIRERWLSHLDPGIKKQDWNSNQDYELMKNIIEKGKKWSKIAKIFGNRTEHSIKNRYHQLISKYLKESKNQRTLSYQQIEKKIVENFNNQIQKQKKKVDTKSQNVFLQESLQTIQVQNAVKCEQDQILTSIKLFSPIIVTKLNDKNQE